MKWDGMVWYDMVLDRIGWIEEHGMVWYDVVLYRMVRFGISCYGIPGIAVWCGTVLEKEG